MKKKWENQFSHEFFNVSMKKWWENQFFHEFFNVSMKKWWENPPNTKQSILFLCKKALYYMGMDIFAPLKSERLDKNESFTAPFAWNNIIVPCKTVQ